ncbi:MAG: sugar transferase [Actinobacteria bacterium]|nr:sugar transferase [Actinomycetota bacterium]
MTTVPQTLRFFVGQIGYLKERGIDVHCLSSPGPELDEFALCERVPVHAIEMPRRITPLRDIAAVLRIWRRLHIVKPHIVHAHTPKGGLLGMVGAWLARVPVRIYHIHGLPFMTATGYKRVLLILTEKLACRLADQVLCVSDSILGVAVGAGICQANKIKVLHNGSINGVDSKAMFNPMKKTQDARTRVCENYNIPEEARIIGYVGRIVRDKGIAELAGAWNVLRKQSPEFHLVVVGAFESQDPVQEDVIQMLYDDARVHFTGRVKDPSELYGVMDVLALPSYREGFPVVPMEAAAMAVPVVATRVPGCIDAVQDNVTGALVPAYDAAALREAIARYLQDPELRRAHGQAGRMRVERDFQPEVIWEALYAEYGRLLKEKRLFSDSTESKHAHSIPGKKSYRFLISRALKAAIDFGVALVGLVVLSPLLVAIALLVRIYLGSPVLFRQERPGFKGAPFIIYKFRTMSNARDSHGELLPDEERLNRLGSFLRSSSLDELPELLNVLKGEMSLVGPRPLMMEYLDRYTPEQARRHDVKPGITGWVQINGRNLLTWDEKFVLDLWYVDNWTWWLDVKICLMTVLKVLKREGISAEGYAVMPEFMGSEKK